MSLNIKNESVHDAVRELARLLGVNQTSAVEVAVRAKLAELDDEKRRIERERRIRAAVAELREEIAKTAGPDLRQIKDYLYGPETGLAE